MLVNEKKVAELKAKGRTLAWAAAHWQRLGLTQEDAEIFARRYVERGACSNLKEDRQDNEIMQLCAAVCEGLSPVERHVFLATFGEDEVTDED